eukprot:COSAG01_NODE_23299_length_820_cov_1.481276_1_plen_126_part_10
MSPTIDPTTNTAAAAAALMAASGLTTACWCCICGVPPAAESLVPLATVNLGRWRRRHHALVRTTTYGNVDWGRPADVPVFVVENSGPAENSDPYCSCMPSLDDADAESQLQQCSSLPMENPPAALE